MTPIESPEPLEFLVRSVSPYIAKRIKTSPKAVMECVLAASVTFRAGLQVMVLDRGIRAGFRALRWRIRRFLHGYSWERFYVTLLLAFLSACAIWFIVWLQYLADHAVLYE